MTDRRAAIITLGRKGGMGEARRVDSWAVILRAAGYEPHVIALRAEHGPRVEPGVMATVVNVVRGRAVPETLAWSAKSLSAALDELQPDVRVAVTARAFDPRMAAAGPVILDLVDQLSVSYRDRATITASLPHRLGFRTLAPTHRRFERNTAAAMLVTTTAAGWRDAERLNANWLPIVMDIAPPVTIGDATHDLLFFGNLAYLPNVAALQRIARFWPAVQRRRPGTTLLVAGANPGEEVRAAASAMRWTLHGAFEDLGSVVKSCRVAIAPIDHTAGMQIKVLEAAAFALPQVVTPNVASGYDPAFPLRLGATDDEFVDAVLDLLDDEQAQRAEGAAAQRHVATHYSASRWATEIAGWLEGSQAIPRLAT